VDTQERHYNINKLNVIFAVSSVILLLSLGWMLADDYSRSWKEYQKDFRTLEIEKTRIKYDAAAAQLGAGSEYQELVEKLEIIKKDYDANCSNLKDTESEIEQLKAENDMLIQDQKFSTAKLDAARYRFESQQAHHGEGLEKSQDEYEALKKKVGDLNIQVEQSNQKLGEKVMVIDDCGAQLREGERQKQALSKKMNVLALKLEKIDPDKMDFANRIADMTRDLPVIDLANPNFKIEQIVLKDITDDVKFMRVPKVDRCITCHLGISDPDYEEATQPFKTHPKLDVFIGRDSPHPMEEFGCTVCHGGRGRGTDFTSTVHTPSSLEQAQEWKEKLNWQEYHHWDKPMLPKQYIQSSCIKCHSGQTIIKEAEKLNLGLQIIEKAGCYSCHTIERYKDWPKPGPNLTKLASKVSRDWAYRWIDNPKSFRHNTWMPSFFNQSNNSDPESQLRVPQEIHAIVNFLFKQSKEYNKDDIPVTGDLLRGEELVASVGCMACHQIKPESNNEISSLDSLRKEHGPNFFGVGTKTSSRWLYNWIKDPPRYHPETNMPNLRLTDQEAADTASYLSSLNNDDFNKSTVPQIHEGIIDDIAFNFLSKTKTQAQSRDELSAMSLNDKLSFTGKKLIRHYGCFSCHDITGFETDKPIGTELTEEGDKSIHKLDFGFIHMDHSNYAWFTQKLKEPRIFDKGRIRAPDEKLRMPNYHFTDHEIEAIVTVLLGLVREKPKAMVVPRSTKNLYIEEGQKIVRQMNCLGCHIIEGEGGSIQSSVKDWLVKYDNRSEAEAEAVVTSFSPPNLIGEGKKVRAEWLFDFIHNPTTIRPWLKSKMPTFKFSASELNILLKYFTALDDQEFPFEEIIDTKLSDEEYVAGEKLFSDDYFACAKCHIVGNQFPGGSPDSWAPNFALAKKRLRPDWIIQWIKDPQSLLPGTKMPNYFDPDNFDVSGPDDILNGDEHEQIRILRNYLLTLSEIAPVKKQSPPPPETITPQISPTTNNN